MYTGIHYYYLAFAKGGPADGFLFFGGSRWWLGGSVHVTFSRHLEKAYTRYCPLSSPKRAECLRVCFHCLSGIIVTLNHSYRIRTSMPDAGWRSWRTFLERFWLRWFSLLCTYWGQAYWHNASLVFPVLSICVQRNLTTQHAWTPSIANNGHKPAEL